MKSHRTARRWRSFATRSRESRTCTLYPWEAANRGGSRTGTPRSRVVVDARWSGDCLRVDEPPASRLWRIDANSATPGRGSPIADIPAAARYPSISRPMPRAPGTPGVSNDRPRRRPSADGSRRAPGERHHRGRSRFGIRRVSKVRRDSRQTAAGLRSCRSAQVPRRFGSPGATGADFSRSRHSALSGVLVGGWSPDGSQIAFEAAIDGNTDVYVVGRDGGHLRRLTTEPSMDGVPSWSADGRWIYFASTRAGAIADIWRVSSDGSQAIRLTRNGGFEPRESRDGRYLFYLDRPPAGLAVGGTARLMRLPLDGGQEEPVLERVRPFLWSVTDTGIVFVTREPDFDAIDVVPVQRSAGCPRGPARISATGDLHTHDGVPRWALGFGHEVGAVRFRPHAAR